MHEALESECDGLGISAPSPVLVAEATPYGGRWESRKYMLRKKISSRSQEVHVPHVGCLTTRAIGIESFPRCKPKLQTVQHDDWTEESGER